MDLEHAPDADLELELDPDLDLGDVGFPPAELDASGPERRSPRSSPAADQAFPMLTPVIAVSLLLFGALGMATIRGGAAGGPSLAWALGGAFSVLYIGLFWAGAKFIERHR